MSKQQSRPSIDQLKKLENKRPKKSNTSKVNKAKKSKKFKWLLMFVWVGVLSPFLVLSSLVVLASFELLGPMPSVEELDNPKTNLASEILTADGKELGKYYTENRTPIKFEEISPYLVDALVATEDERFFEHSGIDLRSLARAVMGGGSRGGASTLTQQLAKMLFTEDSGTKSKSKRVIQKIKEWVIAFQLEKRYTKKEIIALYLNRFDYIYQAVGVKSATQIYFGKKAHELNIEEASILAGMAKNPVVYNPKRNPENATRRREVVLKQWLKNSQKGNKYLSHHISQSSYDSLRQLPLGLNFTVVSHDEGAAPYFREILREEIQELLQSKDENGDLVYSKPDGEAYNIYRDGLKIYTSLDSKMQEYAEYAVKEHLGKYLQKTFFKSSKYLTNWPFDNNVELKKQKQILGWAIKDSERYKMLAGKMCPQCHLPEKYVKKKGDHYECKGNVNLPHDTYKWDVLTENQITEKFNTPVKMKVFTWENEEHEKDTLLSPLDSIKYYKAHVQSGFMAMEPQTGFIKAWVGGPDFKHFKYDHVKKSRRQVGSTFKPFVYATLFRDKENINPCTEIINREYCLDYYVSDNTKQSWCPSSDGHIYDGKPISLRYGLASSLNPVTAYVMSQTSPQAVIQLAGNMGINTENMEAVNSLALGVFDVNVLEMVGAYSTFANKGMYVEPTFIVRIEDKNGNVIYEASPKINIALDEKTNSDMLTMLKGVTSGVRGDYGRNTAGTALRLRGQKTESRPYVGFTNVIAGKTGTTQSNADGWFIGMTPDLVAGAWSGWEDRAIRFPVTSLGQGANMALPIWGYFMNKVYEDPTLDISKGDFEFPAGYNYCTENAKQDIDNLLDEDSGIGF